jgi:prevent-host-death family protein
MPSIKPVSDLRNYSKVLREVAIGSPVFLTKNGHGRYALLDISDYKEYEKMLSWQKLKAELDEGRRSGEEKGWLQADSIKSHFEERYGGKD